MEERVPSLFARIMTIQGHTEKGPQISVGRAGDLEEAHAHLVLQSYLLQVGDRCREWEVKVAYCEEDITRLHETFDVLRNSLHKTNIVSERLAGRVARLSRRPALPDFEERVWKGRKWLEKLPTMLDLEEGRLIVLKDETAVLAQKAARESRRIISYTEQLEELLQTTHTGSVAKRSTTLARRAGKIDMLHDVIKRCLGEIMGLEEELHRRKIQAEADANRLEEIKEDLKTYDKYIKKQLTDEVHKREAAMKIEMEQREREAKEQEQKRVQEEIEEQERIREARIQRRAERQRERRAEREARDAERAKREQERAEERERLEREREHQQEEETLTILLRKRKGEEGEKEEKDILPKEDGTDDVTQKRRKVEKDTAEEEEEEEEDHQDQEKGDMCTVDSQKQPGCKKRTKKGIKTKAETIVRQDDPTLDKENSAPVEKRKVPPRDKSRANSSTLRFGGLGGQSLQIPKLKTTMAALAQEKEGMPGVE